MARPGSLCIATATVLVILAATVQPGAAQFRSCHDATGCSGNMVTVSNARDCCLGNGLSFINSAGVCRQCIVHGFQRTSLLVDETASQQTIEITLDIKGNTIRETVSPRIVELNFSLTCRDSSNGGVQPQAIDQNDYSSQECGRNFSLHRTRRRTTQVVVTLGSDNIVEGTEFLSLELQLTSPTQQSAVNDAGNIFFQNISTITVNDRTDVVIRFSQNDYEGVEGPDRDERRNNTPCTVTVELDSTRLEIPLRLRFIPQTIQENVANPNNPTPAEISGGSNATRDMDFNATEIVRDMTAADGRGLNQAITIFDDQINEALELFVVVLRVETNFTVRYTRQATVCRIPESDPIDIGFTRQRIELFEEEAQLSTPIRKNRRSEQTFTARIEISTPLVSGLGRNATPVSDFEIRDMEVPRVVNRLLSPEQDSIEFAYRIIHDLIPENSEIFQLSITSLPNTTTFACEPANGCYRDLIIIIQDNDAVEVGFVDTLIEVNEADGNVTLNVSITSPVTGIEIMFRLNVDSVDGSAESDSAGDTFLEPTPGVQDFPRITAGNYFVFEDIDIPQFEVLRGTFDDTQRWHTFSFPIYVDDVPEGVEELNLTLSLRDDNQLPLREGSVNITPASATVRIRDTRTVVVGFEMLSYTVGEANGQVELCVNITMPRQQNIGTVTFDLTVETQDGSGVSPADYTNASMTLGPFTSQRPRQCFSISIINDTVLESNETFTARLTLIPASVTTITPDRIIVDPPETTVLITDNDLRIEVGYVTNETVLESDGVATLTVAISVPSEDDPIEASFYLLVNTMDGSATATAPSDYDALNNFRLGPFSNDMRQISFNVSIVNDDIPEDAEMFRATLTLEGDDQAELVTVSPDEADVTILDNDGITVGYVETSVTVFENSGVATLTVAISMPPGADPIETSFYLLVNTMDGSATAGAPSDYGALNNFRLGPFSNGVRQLSFNVSIVNDDIPEDAEMFRVSLTPDPDDRNRLGSRVIVSPDEANVTINDDNDGITVGYVQTSVNVFENSGVATLTVAISVPPRADPIETSFYLLVNTMDGSATAGAPSDYGALINFRLGPFSNGVRQLSFNVSIVNDNIPEDAEMFRVSLTLDPDDRNRLGSRVIVSPDEANVTINDDNDGITVGYVETSVNVFENSGVATLTVAISVPPGADPIETSFYLLVNTMDGSATAGAPSDYGALTNFRLGPFSNDVRRLSFNVSIMNDDIPEDAEMFQVSLTLDPGDRNRLGSRVIVSPDEANVTINDDNDGITVGYVQTSVNVFENSGVATLTVAISVPPGADPIETSFYLLVNTMDGSATAGAPSDYGALTNFRLGPFSNDVRRLSFNVSIVNDDIPEDAEMFTVSLTLDPDDRNRLGSRVIVSPDEANVTINDDNDGITVGYVETSVNVFENSGVATLTVAISVPPGADPIETSFYLLVNTMDGSATAGAPSDYGALTNFRLGPFSNDVRRLSFNVSIVNDDIPEDAEMFTVSLTLDPDDRNRLGSRVIVSPDEANVTINDDNDGITVGYVQTSVNVFENSGVATLTVAISVPPRADPIETSFYLLVNTMDGSATAGAPSDYGALTNFRLGPFSNDMRQLSFNVSIVNDNIPEDAEMFRVSLTLDPDDRNRLGSRVMVSPDEANVTINDDNDEITVGYVETSVTVFENDGVATLTVAISMPSGADPIETSFYLLVNTMDGSATAAAPSDYGALNNFRLGPFSNGVRQLSFNVSIVNDDIPEDSEMFRVRLTLDPDDRNRLGSRVMVSPDEATVTINEDNDGVTIGIEPPINRNVTEGPNSRVEYCVVITAPDMTDPIERSDFNICVSTMDGTAMAGQDYQAVTNMPLGPFGDRNRRQCFNVTILDDARPENSEDFTVNVHPCAGQPPPGRVIINPRIGRTTIEDEDPVEVGFEQPSYSVDEDVGQFSVCVVVTMPPNAVPLERMFFLSVSTRTGTAGNNDFTPIINQDVGPFSNTTRRQCFSVEINNDMIREDMENFFLDLTTRPGEMLPRVTISPDEAEVTINDNDRVTIGIEPPINRVVIEGVNSTVEYCVVITVPDMTDPIERSDFSVCVSTEDGTAMAGQDYQPVINMPLGPFGNNNRRQCFNVSILNDSLAEMSQENFMVNVQFCPGQPQPDRVDIDPSSGTTTIIDADRVVVGFEQPSYSVDEDVGQFNVCVVVTMPPNSVSLDRMFSLSVNTRPDTAGNNDFTPIINQTVGPFSNTTRRQCFSVEINNDMIPEDMESFFLDLTTRPGEMLDRVTISPDVAEVTINDNDGVTIGIEPPINRTVTEGPNSRVEYCVVITAPDMTDPIERSDFSICVSTMDGTAIAGQDYQPVINMPLGPFGDRNRRQCFNVTILDDARPENSEDFTVDVHPCIGQPPPGRVIINPRIGRTTIEDEDPVEVGFEQPSYNVVEGVGQFNVCVVVTVPPNAVPLERMFSLSVSTRPGTAGNNDFTPIINQTVGPFSDTTRRQCFSVEIIDDMIRENNENFFLDLTTRPGEMLDRVTINPAVAEVAINEDDRVTIGIESPINRTVTEGSTVQYCVVITVPDMTDSIERSDFSVCVSTVDGTATAGQDYQPVINMPLGPFGNSNRRRCFNVSILNDNLPEMSQENFMVNVQFCPGQPQPENVDINPSSGTTTIVDADEVIVGFEQVSYSEDEGVGVFSVCVEVISPLDSAPLDRMFSLSVSTRPGTAGNNDFTPIINQDVGPFSNTTRRQCFSVEINDDMIRENNENFFLDLTTRPGEMLDRVTINPAVAEVTINDNDDVQVEIEPPINLTVPEGPNTTVERCVVISGSDPIERSDFNVCVSTMDGTAIAGQDYVAVTNMPLGPFGSGNRRQCFNVTILDDTQPENSEDFTVSVHPCPGPPPPRVIFNPRRGRTTIEDDDPVEIGFEQPSYNVDENVGQFNVCVVVTVPPNSVPLDRMFSLSVSTRPGTAGNTDFTPISNLSVGPFSNTTRRQCFSVEITNDMIPEDMESFFLDLRRRPGDTLPRVTISPDEAEVTINDDDRVTIGIEPPVNRTVTEGSTVEYCVVITTPDMTDPIERSDFNVCVSTVDGTAMAPQDYDEVRDRRLGPFNDNNRRQCFNVTIRDDTQRESTEYFDVTVHTCPGPTPDGPGRIIFNPRSGRTTIIDERPLIRVNDTVTGDPLMTVPLNVGNDTRMLLGLNENERVSLCYEVHGDADANFNLVSDVCVSVNAHYERVRSDVDINVIDRIGVRAVNNASQCHNITADLNGCRAFVDGAEITTSYRMGGISVRKYPTRVRIAVPNCEDHDLVMWVFCQTGTFENGNMTFNSPMIRYVIARGFNLAETSHGILGQFWNIRVDVVRYSQPIDGVIRDDTYDITVNYPDQRRQFVGFLYPLTWEFEENQCLYVGNGQGGPIDEVDNPNDPVLYGEYSDYKVDSIFGTEFDYDHFESARCSQPP